MKLVACCAFGLAVVSGCRAAPMPPIVHHASAQARAYVPVPRSPPTTVVTPDLSDADLAKLAEEEEALGGAEWVLRMSPAAPAPPCLLCPAH
jgi:hypothetical protein